MMNAKHMCGITVMNSDKGNNLYQSKQSPLQMTSVCGRKTGAPGVNLSATLGKWYQVHNSQLQTPTVAC